MNGNIPAKLMDKQIPRSLGSLFQLRETFNRDDEIDQEERNELMGVMKKHENEVYSEEENEMVGRITKKMESVKDDLFTPLNSPEIRTKVSFHFVHFFDFQCQQIFARLAQMSIAHIEGESDGYMKCVVNVDASLEECAAYCFTLMSRKRRRISDTKNVLARDAKSHNCHSQDYVLVRDLGFGKRPRQWLTRHVWKRVGGERIVYVNESIEHSNLFPSASSEINKYVRAGVTGFLSCELITEHLTKLKYVTQINLGGNIPHQVVTLSAAGLLNDSIAMRQLFSKDYEIDLEMRGLLVEKLNNVNEYSKVESDEIERGKLLFKQFRNSEQGKVTVNTDNELVSAVAVQFEGKAWCRLSTTVRCGGKEALAFLLSVDSRSLMREQDFEMSEVVTEKNRLADNDKVENDKGHTQVVSMLERKVLGDGTEVQNSMNRRMTWKKATFTRSGKSTSGKSGSITSEENSSISFYVYSSPTTVLEARSMRSSRKAMKFGLRSKEIPIVQDKSVAATKITQVSETECKVSERSESCGRLEK